MKKLICWFIGHRWRHEKEFASCGRCHTVKAWRDLKWDN